VDFDELKARLERRVDAVTASRSLPIEKVRKDQTVTVDARPSLLLAHVLRDDGGRPVLTVRLTLNRPNSVRPELLVSVLIDWVRIDERLLRVHRTHLYIPGKDGMLDPLQVVSADFAWWRQPIPGEAVS
jgi:hypothetical protein